MRLKADIDRVISKPDRRVLLEDVHLVAESPAVIWVQGGNGAGKTVLTSILSGKAFQENLGYSIEGEVLLEREGRRLSARVETTAFIENISYLPQKLGSSLLAIHFQDDICFSYEGRFPEFRGEDRHEKNQTVVDEIESLNNTMNLWLHLKKRIGEASYGETRRIEFACTLCPHATIVLLDEPLSGLDPEWRATILKDLQIVAKGNDSILVITSHCPPEDYQIKPDVVVQLPQKKETFGFLAPLEFALRLCKTNPLEVVDSISLNQFEIERKSRLILSIGEFVFQPYKINWIEGSNGSGKSSLLLFLAGLLRVSWARGIKISGNVEGGPFGGWPIRAPNDEDRLFLQNPYRSFIRRSVQEDVAGTPDDVMLNIASHWGPLNRRPTRFSFGELKALQFLLLPPDVKVVLFDEPLLGIHPDLHRWVLETLDGIAKSGRFVLATSEENIVPVKDLIKDANILRIPRP
jgi:ABC-type multidrug transport system ATPase subunit